MTPQEAKNWAELQTHEAPKVLLAEIERLERQCAMSTNVQHSADKYLLPVCRGSYKFGNACGHCEKCKDEREVNR